ncbi:SH3 domain-containing C40 family peptidase [Salinimicrobium catena]|uniref:SH3 domain-containing C40 family peptidase n=1 Tax=Salinimicrobium catena TaxID=390640 RepID=UPI002FE444FD
MKRIQKSLVLTLAGMSLLFSCKNEEVEAPSEENAATPYIAEVRQQHAPDKRVALFDVEAKENGDQLVLRGESNLPAAVNDLKTRLDEKNVQYVDSIQMLPSKELGENIKAVVKNSVANIRSNPGHSAELATQATLGTPLKVFKKDDNWYLVQTPDGYLSWVDSGGIVLMTNEELADWKAEEKLIFLKPFGESYQQPDSGSQSVSDLVAGDILILRGEEGNFYDVEYPDGRTAFIAKDEAQRYQEWLDSLDHSEESLVATSKRLMGLPYLWGGTSPKGVDCSGYTKTIFFLNGMIIPRDASQQVHTGKVVDSTKNFENLQKGDLLFFGKPATDSTKERVVHVGMWIGDNKFIHSMGDVHVSTMDTTAADFDEYNYNRYLRTKRLLGEEDSKLIQLTQSDLFMTSREKEDTVDTQ